MVLAANRLRWRRSPCSVRLLSLAGIVDPPTSAGTGGG